MSLTKDSTAVTKAREHVEAWTKHDFDSAREGLANDVWVTATTIDPNLPATDLHGIDGYMTGLMQFAQAVVPGSAEMLASIGDDRQALLTLNVRARFGPDAPELTLPGARLYQFDDDGKIKIEHVVFFVSPD